MARDYAAPSPVDRLGNPLQTLPANVPAINVTTSGTLLSSVITLDDNATRVEVAATGSGAVAIKWFGSVVGNPSVTVANLDHVVPAQTVRLFVIPPSIRGQAASGSIIGGYGAINGLYKQIEVLPIAPIGTSSIIVTQYS